jgi:eukaryotic-like serine/threonine-protein kinase
MSLAPGARLGPFQIVDLLGAGGMGEVYRARDLRLDRTVALKVLAADLAGGPDERARFEREARAIASLTHPHICTLYDVGHHEGAEFLVMELLEGPTLAARLETDALPLAEALTYATQVASALAAAHRLGLVHRDLKPANIVLTRSGAKLLDFGLAKLRAERQAGIEGLTRTSVTVEGTILGTLHYMAPEQLEGREVDERADIFAFGVVLFEMLTGKRAFDGASQAGVIAAILHEPPPRVTALVKEATPALERLLTTCLAKSPDDRWSSAHDVWLQLKVLGATPDRPSGTPDRAGADGHWAGSARQRLPWAIAALATFAALITGAWAWSSSRVPATETRADVLSILPSDDTRLDYGEAAQISPDGRLVAFVATDRAGHTGLYVRRRESLDVRLLPGTDEATMPFWAPDSRRLGFFAHGHLKTVALGGGAPQTLARAAVPRGGTWSVDDVILFLGVPSQPPFRVAASGGEAEHVPTPPTEGLPEGRWFPSFLPDGRHYLYLAISEQDRRGGTIRVGSLDSAEAQDLVASRMSAVYSAGFLLFRREAVLMAQPFDAATRQLTSAAVPVAQDVGVNAITYQGLFSAADTGDLVYQGLRAVSEPVWFDRQGRRLGAVLPPGDYSTMCLTPDARQVVYVAADPASGNIDLWAVESDGGAPSRLTFNPAVDFYPVCGPTGEDVVFSSLRVGAPNLYRLPLATPGSEMLLLESPVPKLATDWSSDGRLVVYSVLNRATAWDIEIVPLDGLPGTTFAGSGAEETSGRLSPDRRWMAYVSNETGTFEVYVRPFPEGSGKWQISRGGGKQPQWRRDGRELFYVAPDRRLIAVDVAGSPAGLSVGRSETLFDTKLMGWERAGPGTQYAVTADGQRFLVNTAADVVAPVTLIRQWAAAIR